MESITELIPLLVAWSLTRLFEPIYVANLISFSGYLLSGLMTLRLLRSLKVSLGISLLGGLCVLALPGVKQMMLTGVVAIFAVPVILQIAIIAVRLDSVSCSSTTRTFGALLTVCTICFFVSYNFFVLASVLSAVLLIWKLGANRSAIIRLFCRIPLRRLTITIVGFSLLLILVFSFAKGLLDQTRSEYGAPYSIYPREEVLKDSFTLRGFITRDYFHFLGSPRDFEEEGYSQQYAGLVIVLGAMGSVCLFLRNRERHGYGPLLLLSVTSLTISLGRIVILGVEIPSVREFLRFVFIGMRRYSISGLWVEVLLVVMFTLFISDIAAKIQRGHFRLLLILLIGVTSLLDLNLFSRRFAYSSDDAFGSLPKDIGKSSEALYLPQRSMHPADSYIFNAPINNDHAGLFGAMSSGPNCLMRFLHVNRIRYLIANQREDGELVLYGAIQDAVQRFFVIPPEVVATRSGIVPPWSQAMKDLYGTNGGFVLLTFNDIDDNNGVCANLAQFVSVPQLRLSDSQLDRFIPHTQWATHSHLKFTLEALPSIDHADSNKHEIGVLRMTVVRPPSGTIPAKLTITSSLESVEVDLGLEAEEITIRANINEQILMAFEGYCPRGDTEDFGELADSTVCFGISDFIVTSQ